MKFFILIPPSDDHETSFSRRLHHRHNRPLPGHCQPLHRDSQDSGESQQKIELEFSFHTTIFSLLKDIIK